MGPPPPRLPLAYPPVGVPFGVDASGNCLEGRQPVPDDWLELLLKNYEENHRTVDVELKKLTEETKNISADVVRILAKINQERTDTRRLIDAVRSICGQELLDSVLKDVYSTTNFEMSKKRGTSGYTYRSVVYPEGGKEGGTMSVANLSVLSLYSTFIPPVEAKRRLMINTSLPRRGARVLFKISQRTCQFH